jgi:hypothetical protein
MSDEQLKADIMALLKKGRMNAIKGCELAKTLGFNDDRTIRLAIRELIRENTPIAASTGSKKVLEDGTEVIEPPGYFIAESRLEADTYLSVMKGRLIEDALRRRDFKRAAAWYFEGIKQLALL